MPGAGLCSCWGGRVLPLLLAYVCYLLLGATIFQLLEKQAEAQSRNEFQLEKLRFLENYTCLDQWALEQFVQVIMEAWVKGVNPKGNSTNPSNWDFGSSFFFAGTVVTTIGYGNLAPSTEAGQVFCVFYALLGIPLNVIFLNHLGTGLRAHLAPIERWEDQPRRSQLLRVLGLALFLTLGTLVILIFPPMVFSHVEGWSFGEGFYFAFITLSTIGFGDYVVGHPLNFIPPSGLLPSQGPLQTPPGKPESQQRPGSFQKVSSMNIWPLSGMHPPGLTFPLPDCNIPDQKERFRPIHPKAWKLWPLPFPPPNSKWAPTWLGSSAQD
uniref:2P domain potassium channel Talk-1 n=1 Tax=Aotus nancymaae TaxID=37293 RepID=A0A2K5CZN7_AOTNA|nr:potassium channel subfamily K member 16 isoform X1 [Aotus nancymaae]